MTRFFRMLVLCALAGALVCVPVSAEDPPKKLTAEEKKELETKWNELISAGIKANRAESYPEAIKSFEEALKVARQLYNPADFPTGHLNLANTLTLLGLLYHSQEKYADAELCFKDAISIHNRLSDRNESAVIDLREHLAEVYAAQGRYVDATQHLKDAIDTRKRMLKQKYLISAHGSSGVISLPQPLRYSHG